MFVKTPKWSRLFYSCWMLNRQNKDIKGASETSWIRSYWSMNCFPIHRTPYRLYLQLFIGSYLVCVVCICLRVVVPGTSCVVLYFWFVFVSFCVPLCCQFLWIVHFWLALRYSLIFIVLAWNSCKLLNCCWTIITHS